MKLLKLRVPHEVAAPIRRLHPDLKKKVRFAFETISRDPLSGKALKDDLQGLRGFRVGRFRIVYSINAREEIEIVTIGPRRIIYQETLRLLKRK